MSFAFSFQHETDSKYYRMRAAVNAINEYFQSKAEDTALAITKHLQGISLCNDLSIFDPHVKETTQFFISLYELMNRMEQRSSFSWYCIDVLQNACKNPASRQSLINTYQFIPTLARLLGDHLTLEKKIELLRVIQDLSCGIKISWQIPHLPHLMKTLANWIETQEGEIVTLSLGVLVNLCYKNLPAIYTLTGNIDIKRLMRVCTTLEGPVVELHTCKLLIILNFTDDQHDIINTLISATFKSIIHALQERNSVFLRQIIVFFLDVTNEQHLNTVVHNDYYNNQMKILFNLIGNNDHVEGNSFLNNTYDPECIALIFEFLHPLIELKLPVIVENYYPFLIQTTLRWIQNDIVSPHALTILKDIALTLDFENQQQVETVLEPLVKAVPIFLNDISSVKDEEQVLIHIEYHKKITGLLELLKAMVRVTSIRQKILDDIQVDMICKVFYPLFGDDNEMKKRASAPHTATMEAVNLYVNAISLINEITKYNANWINVQNTLFSNKQIHMVLAQALSSGCPKTKTLVLDMCKLPIFPIELVAEMMATIQPVTNLPENDNKNKPFTNDMQELSGPVLSLAQIQRVDDVLEKFERAIAEKNLLNVATSDVMELYEYKLAAAGHSERIAMASIEAASDRCTQLQHRIAQFTLEINRYHQLLLHAEQCQEQQVKISESLKKDVANLTNRLETERGRNKAIQSQLNATETALTEYKTKLENSERRIEELQQSKQQMLEQYNDLKQYIGKIEENATRLEKNLVKKDEVLKKANHTIDTLNAQVKELEEMLKQLEAELATKNAELLEVTKESLARKHMLDTITKVATSQVQV